jgi:ligand-binding sensor domain-containing protein
VALCVAAPAWCGWQTFGLADGLVATTIKAVAVDHSENIWFGSPAGASRFDGVSFRTFTRADGLANEDVRAIFTDHAGRVWFATAAGASCYDGSRWRTFTSANGLASDDVRDVLQDRAGNMWFATGYGVSRYDGTDWLSYQQSAGGLSSNDVSCLYEDRDGGMWFGTRPGGVSHRDPSGVWTTYTTADGLAADWVNCIAETPGGVMWFGTTNFGLSRFDGSSWTRITTTGGLSVPTVNRMVVDTAGFLWAACGTGLVRFDGLAWRAYKTTDGLAASNVLALTIDGSGNVWAGTDNGVSRYDRASWLKFTAASGAQSLLEDHTGTVWATKKSAGVMRYDRFSWTVVNMTNGLASDSVAAVQEDSTGVLWFGTRAGASRYDRVTWHTYTTADGMAGNDVRALARDSTGSMWFATTQGLSRFDGFTWESVPGPGGLALTDVQCLTVDREGRLWCGTLAGVARFDGIAWTRLTTATTAGLASDSVHAVLQDRSGAMWFGTEAGLSRFDGTSCVTFTVADGLPVAWVSCIVQDQDGVLWLGTKGGGVSRFDGTLWHTYAAISEVPDRTISAAIAEHSGSLWFAAAQATVLCEPDRVPPQTVITTPAPALSANTLQTVRYVAAFREVVGIEYSTSLDSTTWSDWTTDDSWIGRNLPDGVHTLRVRARDLLQHVDPTPAVSTFEIDATPPEPVLTAPVNRQPVRDTLVVEGTATDARFDSLRVDLRPLGTATWDPPAARPLARSASPVANGVLARFDTKSLPDGEYELRLAVADTLGLTGVSKVTFVIDNLPPWASQTAPALVAAEPGGDVYTTNREAHVYLPPHALARDATVHLDPLDAAVVPATMPDGATRVAPGYAFDLEGVPLTKTAILELAVPEDVAPPGARLVIYAAGQDTVWRRVGGTFDASTRRLSAPVSAAGRYAVAAESGSPYTPGAALALSLTPRVFSAQGGPAGSSIGIGFVLARQGAVTVTVHNRAGRLVREVMSGTTLGAGSNLVRWDGKDEDNRAVEAGMYLVTVQALGEKQVRALAVVR